MCGGSTGKRWRWMWDAGIEEKHTALNAPPDNQDTAKRRKGVVRTAWGVGTIAVAIYVAFILSGVLNA